MERPRAHFQIVGLMNDTSTVGPKTMQGQNEVLEIHRVSRSSSSLLVVADENQAEASKNGYRVSRNRTSDFNELRSCFRHHGECILLAAWHLKRLNRSTRWFILQKLEQLTRQNLPA